MSFDFKSRLGTDGFMGALIIPDKIAQQLKAKKIKRVIAHVTANEKELTLYAGVARKKEITYMMFSKANQKFLNVSSGDTILISLNEDKSKYQAPMTEELEAVLLSDYDAYQIFEKLTPGRQRNIIFMVYRAKDSQKRVDIALNAMENLKVGNHDPFKFEKLLG
jgi:hypothetical protein